MPVTSLLNLLENPSSSNKTVNEYGETLATKITQEQKRLTEDEVVLLISEYKASKSTYVLAEQFGCHRVTVTNILKRHGVPFERKAQNGMKPNAFAKKFVIKI